MAANYSAALAAASESCAVHAKLVSGAKRLMLPEKVVRSRSMACSSDSLNSPNSWNPTPTSAQKPYRTPHNARSSAWRSSVCPRAPERHGSGQVAWSPLVTPTSAARLETRTPVASPATSLPEETTDIPGEPLKQGPVLLGGVSRNLMWGSPAGKTPAARLGWQSPVACSTSKSEGNYESRFGFEWTAPSPDEVISVSPDKAQITEAMTPVAVTLERLVEGSF